MRTHSELEALARQLGASPTDLQSLLERLDEPVADPTPEELAGLDADMAAGIGVLPAITEEELDAMGLAIGVL